jgi:hypothetical protein
MVRLVPPLSALSVVVPRVPIAPPVRFLRAVASVEEAEAVVSALAWAVGNAVFAAAYYTLIS